MKNPAAITLPPFTLSDAEDFISWAGDDNVRRYCRWNTFASKDEAVAFLTTVIKSHPWYRAICEGDQPVGTIFVMPGELGKDQRRGEIGYTLAKSHWGKGIATEAVRKATAAAFEELELELERVEGLVFVENKASQKGLEKAGFERDGVLKKYFFVKGKSVDVVVYSIVVSSQMVHKSDFMSP